MASKKAEKEREQLAALETLRAMLKKGDTLYMSIESVARSGMSRTVRVFSVDRTDEVYPLRVLTTLVGQALGRRLANRNGRTVIFMGGCGYNVGHTIADDLGYALYGNMAEEERRTSSCNAGHFRYTWL